MAKSRNLLADHFPEEAPVEAFLRTVFARLKQTARLMCGVPDYETFVRHRKITHPNEPIPSYAEFFNMCQLRRFGGEGMQARCC
jgi:uncharacterized short protein YbdD (DUF466 family)